MKKSLKNLPRPKLNRLVAAQIGRNFLQRTVYLRMILKTQDAIAHPVHAVEGADVYSTHAQKKTSCTFKSF